jgi:hypothetical protein
MFTLFEARASELPFPHRTISWGELQRGGAVPLQLHIDNLEALVTTIGRRDYGRATRHQGTADTQCCTH